MADEEWQSLCAFQHTVWLLAQYLILQAATTGSSCRLRFPASSVHLLHPDAHVSLQAAPTPLAHYLVAGIQRMGRIRPLESVNLASDLLPTNDLDPLDQNDLVDLLLG